MGIRINRVERSSELFIKCQEMAYGDIRRVLSNNTWMLKQKRLSLNKQLLEFKSMGISVQRSYYDKLLHGQRRMCNLVFLQFFAIYWNMSLSDLMAVDMAKEDELRRLKESETE